MLPEDRESLARIQARLLQVASTKLDEPSLSSFSSGTSETIVASKTRNHLSVRKPGLHRFSVIAALFIVCLITAAAVFPFVLMKGTSQPPTVSPPPQKLMRAGMLNAIHSLHMVNERVGWAMQNAQNYGPVLRTIDGGKTWKPIMPPGLAVNKIEQVYIFDETMALINPISDKECGDFYRTMDGGATWQRLAWPVIPTQHYCLPTFLDHTHGWVLENDVLFNTNDGGKSWRQVGILPPKSYGYSLTWSSLQTGWLFTNTFPATLYVTHDSGRTWQQQLLPTPPQQTQSARSLGSLTFFTQEEGFLIATFGKGGQSDQAYLYRTQDSGNSWQIAGGTLPWSAWQVVDNTHVLASEGGAMGRPLKISLLTLIKGKWVQTSIKMTIKDAGSIDILPSLTGLVLQRAANGITEVYKTSNGGKSWQKIGILPGGA